MPVEAHRGRVVVEHAAARVEDRLGEVLHGLSRMHLRAGRDHGLDVDALGIALQHAVGEEQEAVAGLERQVLHAVLAAPHGPERQVGFELHPLDASVAQPERQWMPGVDDGGGPGAQVVRPTWPVTKPPFGALSARPSLARRACSASPTPARRGLRRPPIRSVASSATLTSWPMASVSEKCSIPRSSAKSKVSPPTLPAGSSQPAIVNCPASHV
jgi:hypothetical protein